MTRLPIPDVWHGAEAQAADQLDLLGMVRRGDTDTARRAAASAAKGAPLGRDLVLRELLAAGYDGLSDFELEDRTGIPQTSIGKRRQELRDGKYSKTGEVLVEGGQVKDSGERRPNARGSLAIVWTLTEKGRVRARQLGATP